MRSDDEQVGEGAGWSLTWSYYDPPGKEMPAVDCPECRGKGSFPLLLSVKSCEACGGTGKVSPHGEAGDMRDDAGAAEAGAGCRKEVSEVPGSWVTTHVYDAKDQLIETTERFVPAPLPDAKRDHSAAA